jgi:anaerobic dimethyl sulfoxide reductase subunit B (iron-sulfur subunit)
MQMCDFCIDRLTEGKKPICVAACPMRALDAGPIDELAAKYGSDKEAVGFVYSDGLDPSVVFKPKVRD